MAHKPIGNTVVPIPFAGAHAGRSSANPGEGGVMDLSRLPDWCIATSAYRRGDARKLSKFIKTHGVLVGIESNELAALLLAKPDPRKETKPETVEMLRYVRSEMFKREELKSGVKLIDEHIDKVSARLLLRGWSTERIGQVIRTRYEWSSYPIKDTWKPYSNQTIFIRVAMKFGIDADGVKKAYERDVKRKSVKFSDNSRDTT